MKIEVNNDLMQIEIYKNGELVSRLNFEMCDEEMLRDNASELLDLFLALDIDCETVIGE